MANTGHFNCRRQIAGNKLMIALHWYPFLEYPMAREYTAEIKGNIISTFERLHESYTSKGIPINFTEFMVPNLGDEGKKYSRSTRLECLKDFCKYAGLYKISATLWDDGMVHGVVNRTAPYNQTEGDGFISALISEWENGWNQNTFDSFAETFEQNRYSAVSVLDLPVQIKEWGDYPISLAMENSPLYIKCSAQDAAALKQGFSIVGMNLNITGIDIIF